jgi:RimJ/RimL family protein N-acetyltransferase
MTGLILSKEEITVKEANQLDSRDIWLWRNDAQSKEMSLNSSEISFEDHSRWFNDLLSDGDRFLYVGYLQDNEKIGVCRFDLDRKSEFADVSINLNPHFRGRNLSAVLLSSAMSVFLSHRKVKLRAVIKNRNITSIRCFTKCGFKIDKEGIEFDYYFYDPGKF